jgi:hypothetical protein
MATAYSAPEGFEPPEIVLDDFRTGAWETKENDYIERLATEAKKNGTSNLLGEVIRFPRGDGYAQYLVWRTKPLQLIWLELGDAWQVEPALIRGLRVADVREQVERAARMQELFSQQKAKP